MNPGWAISRANFTDNDGSLPGIDFRKLSPNSVRSIVEYFFRHGEVHSTDPTIYDNTKEQDIELSAVADPAGLVVSGVASSMHCCFEGLSWDGIEVPVLGMYVMEDSVEIDYRMGSEWTPEKVDAFYRLMSHFISLAPEADVASCECEGVPFPELFSLALDCYVPERKQQAEQAAAGDGDNAPN